LFDEVKEDGITDLLGDSWCDSHLREDGIGWTKERTKTPRW